MDADSRKAVDRRLARIEGQVRGIRKLVEQDAYCLDLLQQIAATTSALNQVSAAVASGHIKNCVLGHGTSDAHAATHHKSREDVLDELDEVMSRLMR